MRDAMGTRSTPPADPGPPIVVHLIDGTYELFRHFYGLRRFNKGKDRRFGAVVGVLQGVLEFVERGETHLGVATDHVIESFRNRLWAGYKTGDGIEPALLAQFHPLEDALGAMGVTVWPMIDLEADDALASAAHLAAQDRRVQKVCIWTPDKDLAQCVEGDRVVQVDRKAKTIRDAAGVREKFGVEPALIPDFLALVGDAADGYPGIAGIGAVGAARLLNRHGPIEAFPPDGAWRAPRTGVAVQAPGHAAPRCACVRRCRPVALARTHPRIRCLDAAHGCAAAARTLSGGTDASRECIALRVECGHGSGVLDQWLGTASSTRSTCARRWYHRHMTPANEKTVELRGGPLDGRRVTVSADATQASLPVDSSDRFSAWAVYRPTSERSSDGHEVWTEYVESQWGDTGLTNL